MNWFKHNSSSQSNILAEFLTELKIPVLILDGSYQVVFANKESKEQLLLPENTENKYSIWQLMPASQKNQIELLFKNAKMSTQSSFKLKFNVPDGLSKPFDVFCQYISQENGQFFILMLNHCFSHPGNAKKLAELQRFEIIGRLASGFAHDFNNVLAAAIGYIALLQHEDIVPHKKNMYLEKLDSVLSDGAKSLRNILIFSQTEDDKAIPLQLQESVSQTLEFVRRLIRRNITISCKFCESRATVNMVPRNLEQIIINLLINARDAITGPGEITVSIEAGVKLTAKNKFSPPLTAGSYHLLKISDTGSGINPAIQNKIFEPYYTTKKETGGSGIGLFVVRQKIAEIGGGIQVKSAVDKGTTFILALPESHEEQSSGKKDSPYTFPKEINSVLIIEDDSEVAEVLTGMLKDVDVKVVLCSSASEAIQLLQKKVFQLILMDFGLPDTNGANLFTELKNRYPQTLTIVTSGYSTRELNTAYPEISPEVILPKPFHLMDLIKLLNQLKSS